MPSSVVTQRCQTPEDVPVAKLSWVAHRGWALTQIRSSSFVRHQKQLLQWRLLVLAVNVGVLLETRTDIQYEKIFMLLV